MGKSSVKEKISIFNQDILSDDIRPGSSELSDSIAKKVAVESDTDSAVIEDLDTVESVKDKISAFNIESVMSTDTEPRHSRPSSSDYSETYEKNNIEERDEGIRSVKGQLLELTPNFDVESEKEMDTDNEDVDETSSIKDRISKFNSLERNKSDKRYSRPNSSDYSDIQKKKAFFETSVSSETEPEVIRRQSTPSSDYSDIHEVEVCRAEKREESSRISQESLYVESIKDKISKFNSETVKSSDTESEVDHEVSRPSSSDYSDIQGKKALFGSLQSNKLRPKPSTLSRTSSDTEPEQAKKQSRPSSSDFSEIFDKNVIVDKFEDISEVTDPTQTVMAVENAPEANQSNGTSTDTDSKQSRGSSPSISMEAKEKIIESQILEKREKEQMSSEKLSALENVIIKSGILQLTIHKATDLMNQDMIGKSDPYVILRFKGQEFRSQTINNSLNPEWNFPVDLILSDAEEINVDIDIEVYDDEYGRDNLEGVLSIPLCDAISKENSKGSWYNLSQCKQGRIFISISYQTICSSDHLHQQISEPKVAASLVKAPSTASSSSEDGVAHNKNIDQSSTDSSLSNKRDRSTQEIQRQEAIDIDDKNIDKKGPVLKSQSSSDYSDTDGEQHIESSSDYDSASNRGKRRPDSFISDTSSDYDSLSNVGSRKPQSFILDDEYDIITEEEAAESEKNQFGEAKVKKERETSSSSESEGPEELDAGKQVEVIPPPDGQQESSKEDKEHDGEFNGISIPHTLDIPYQTPSSVASSSPIISSDLHAEQSSISVEVEHSTVINSNTLEEIDPLVRDFENISHSNTLTKHIDAKTEKKNITVEPKEGSSVSFQSTSRRSSSSCSSLDQALRDGSSESEKSQEPEQDSSKKPSST